MSNSFFVLFQLPRLINQKPLLRITCEEENGFVYWRPGQMAVPAVG